MKLVKEEVEIKKINKPVFNPAQQEKKNRNTKDNCEESNNEQNEKD